MIPDLSEFLKHATPLTLQTTIGMMITSANPIPRGRNTATRSSTVLESFDTRLPLLNSSVCDWAPAVVQSGNVPTFLSPVGQSSSVELHKLVLLLGLPVAQECLGWVD